MLVRTSPDLGQHGITRDTLRAAAWRRSQHSSRKEESRVSSTTEISRAGDSSISRGDDGLVQGAHHAQRRRGESSVVRDIGDMPGFETTHENYRGEPLIGLSGGTDVLDSRSGATIFGHQSITKILVRACISLSVE